MRLLAAVRAALPGGSAGGPARAEVPAPAPGASGVAAVESPRGEEVHYVRFEEGGRIDRHKFRSASYVNWQAVPRAVPGNIVPDFPLINKSFELCYSCAEM